MTREIQADLFEPLNQSRIKKRARYPLRKLFPYGFVNIRLSYENIIFSLIVILLSSVILFSLGIERGKRIQIDNADPNKQTLKRNLNTSKTADNVSQTSLPSENNVDRVSTIYKKADSEERISRSQLPQYNYTIQILTYKDSGLAQKQIQRLTKLGYKPFIIHSRGFYQICVGKYSNRENAKRDLAVLRKSYKDCFIKNIP